MIPILIPPIEVLFSEFIRESNMYSNSIERFYSPQENKINKIFKRLRESSGQPLLVNTNFNRIKTIWFKEDLELLISKVNLTEEEKEDLRSGPINEVCNNLSILVRKLEDNPYSLDVLNHRYGLRSKNIMKEGRLCYEPNMTSLSMSNINVPKERKMILTELICNNKLNQSSSGYDRELPDWNICRQESKLMSILASAEEIEDENVPIVNRNYGKFVQDTDEFIFAKVHPNKTYLKANFILNTFQTDIFDLLLPNIAMFGSMTKTEFVHVNRIIKYNALKTISTFAQWQQGYNEMYIMKDKETEFEIIEETENFLGLIINKFFVFEDLEAFTTYLIRGENKHYKEILKTMLEETKDEINYELCIIKEIRLPLPMLKWFISKALCLKERLNKINLDGYTSSIDMDPELKIEARYADALQARLMSLVIALIQVNQTLSNCRIGWNESIRIPIQELPIFMQTPLVITSIKIMSNLLDDSYYRRLLISSACLSSKFNFDRKLELGQATAIRSHEISERVVNYTLQSRIENWPKFVKETYEFCHKAGGDSPMGLRFNGPNLYPDEFEAKEKGIEKSNYYITLHDSHKMKTFLNKNPVIYYPHTHDFGENLVSKQLFLIIKQILIGVGMVNYTEITPRRDLQMGSQPIEMYYYSSHLVEALGGVYGALESSRPLLKSIDVANSDSHFETCNINHIVTKPIIEVGNMYPLSEEDFHNDMEGFEQFSGYKFPSTWKCCKCNNIINDGTKECRCGHTISSMLPAGFDVLFLDEEDISLYNMRLDRVIQPGVIIIPRYSEKSEPFRIPEGKQEEEETSYLEETKKEKDINNNSAEGDIGTHISWADYEVDEDFDIDVTYLNDVDKGVVENVVQSMEIPDIEEEDKGLPYGQVESPTIATSEPSEESGSESGSIHVDIETEPTSNSDDILKLAEEIDLETNQFEALVKEATDKFMAAVSKTPTGKIDIHMINSETLNSTYKQKMGDIGNPIQFERQIKEWKFNSKFPLLSRNTYDAFRQQWSNLAISITTRYLVAFNYLQKVDITDKRITRDELSNHSAPLYMYKLIGKTPDFHLWIENQLEIIEFKSVIEEPTEIYVNRIIAETIEKYPCHKLVIVFVIMDDSLPGSLKMFQTETLFYRQLRKELLEFEYKNPKLKHYRPGDIKESFSSIETLMDSFPFQPWTTNMPLQENFTREYRVLWEDMLPKLTLVKDMLNEHIIPTNSLHTILPKPSRINISPVHPLNRDANKLAFKTDYGHKGKYLLPYLCGYEKMEIPDLLKQIDGADTTISSIFRTALKSWIIAKPLVKDITRINRYLALLQTDHSKTIFENIGTIFNSSFTSRNVARKILNLKAKEIRNKINEELGPHGTIDRETWKFSKRGTLKLNDLDVRHKFHVRFQRNNEKPIKDQPDYAVMNNATFENINKILKNLPEPETYTFNFDTAYPFSKEATELMYKYESVFSNLLDKLKADPFFKQLWTSMRFMRELVMNIPVYSTKYGETDEFKIIESKELGLLVLASLHPNQNTTGLIKIIQSVPNNVAELLLSDNSLGIWTKVGELNTTSTIIESDFFRLNHKFVVQFDAMVGTYMANQALWFSKHNDILKNGLWQSMYLNFTRDLTYVLDIVYTFLLRSLADISFGKYDGAAKYDDMKLKDARVGSIYRRLMNNWTKFVDTLAEQKTQSKWNMMYDPFFGIPIIDKDDFMFIAYSKQMVPKDDGIDDPKLAWGFFKADLDQQSDWLKSPYNSDFYRSFSYTLEEFNKVLFKPNNPKEFELIQDENSVAPSGKLEDDVGNVHTEKWYQDLKLKDNLIHVTNARLEEEQIKDDKLIKDSLRIVKDALSETKSYAGNAGLLPNIIDKPKIEWEKVSFCSEFIYTATRANFDLIRNKVRGDFIMETKDVSSTDDIASSKVNVPTTESIAKNISGFYPGLVSMNQAESVYFSIHDMFFKADDYEVYLNNGALLRQQPYHPTRNFQAEMELYKITTNAIIEYTTFDELKDDIKIREERKRKGKSDFVNDLTPVIKIIKGGDPLLLYNINLDPSRVENTYIVNTVQPVDQVVKVKRKTEPTLLEVALFNLYKYPNIVVLTPHNKVQTGPKKRQFYQQTVNGRDANSIMDKGFVPYLKVCDQDIITQSGDKKYIKLEKKIKRILNAIAGKKGLFYVSSGDESKFGDTYPLEAFEVLTYSLRDAGYMTESSRMFVSHCLNSMRGRYHIMPRWSQDIIKKQNSVLEKMIKDNNFQMGRVLTVLLESLNPNYLKHKKYAIHLKNLWFAISENYGINKDVGFALGVMNMISTCLTVIHLKVVEDIIEDICPELIVESGGHSDDSIQFVNLPRITADYFRNCNLDTLLKFRLRTNKRKRSIDWNTMSLYGTNNDTGRNEKIDLRTITVLFICLNFYCPRLVGQRPSLFKWFHGPIGEVLQTIYSEEGSFVPLIRYTSAIFKDMPGKSYATDLISSLSRVLHIIQFGGTSTCAFNCMMIANILSLARFGVSKQLEVRFDTLPNLLGGWIAFPHEILEFGFEANTVRLLASAEKVQSLKNELKLMLMTEQVWDLNSEVNQLEIEENEDEVAKNDLELENNNYGGVVMKEEFSRIGDTFMDFEIVFSRTLKTLASFARQFKLYQKEINQVHDSNILLSKGIKLAVESDIEKMKLDVNHTLTIDDTQALKEAYYKSAPYYLYKIESFPMKMVRHLNKYTTRGFQESYLKVPASTKAINRMGYLNRLLSNPFNPKFIDINQALLEDIEIEPYNSQLLADYDTGTTQRTINNPTKRPLLTILHVILIVKHIAAHPNQKIPAENETLFIFLNEVFKNQILKMYNRNYSFTITKLNVDDQRIAIAKMNYSKISRHFTDVTFSYKTNDLVGLLIETVGTDKPLTNTILYRHKRWLFQDNTFLETYSKIKELFDKIKVTQRMVEQNAQILIRLMTPGIMPIIIKAMDDKDVVKDFLFYRFSTGASLQFTNYVSSIHTEIISSVRNEEVIEGNLINRAIIDVWIYDINISKVSFISNGVNKIELFDKKFVERIVTMKSHFSKYQLNLVLSYSILNNNFMQPYFRASVVLDKDTKDVNRTWNNFRSAIAESKKRRNIGEIVPNLIESIDYGGIDEVITSDKIRFICSYSWRSQGVIIMGLKNDQIIVYRSQCSDNEMILMVKLALHYLNENALRNQPLDKIVAYARGDFTYNNDMWMKQTGDRAIKEIDWETLMILAGAIIQSYNVFFLKFLSGQNTLQDKMILQMGEHTVNFIDGKLVTVPYLITPWDVKNANNKVEFLQKNGSDYFGNNDKQDYRQDTLLESIVKLFNDITLMEGKPIRKYLWSNKQWKEVPENVKHVIMHLPSFTLKEDSIIINLLHAIFIQSSHQTSKSVISEKFVNVVYTNITNYLKEVESEAIEIKTITGKKLIKTPKTQVHTTVTEQAAKIIELLTKSSKNARFVFYKLFTVKALLLTYSMNLDVDLTTKAHFVLNQDVRTRTIMNEQISVKVIQKLCDKFDVRDQMNKVLNINSYKRFIDFSNDSDYGFYKLQTIATYYHHLTEINNSNQVQADVKKSVTNLWNIFLSWNTLEDKSEPFIRVDVIPKTKPINSTQEFTETIVSELCLTQEAFQMITDIQQFTSYSIYGSSYIRHAFFDYLDIKLRRKLANVIVWLKDRKEPIVYLPKDL